MEQLAKAFKTSDGLVFEHEDQARHHETSIRKDKACKRIVNYLSELMNNETMSEELKEELAQAMAKDMSTIQNLLEDVHHF